MHIRRKIQVTSSRQNREWGRPKKRWVQTIIFKCGQAKNYGGIGGKSRLKGRKSKCKENWEQKLQY